VISSRALRTHKNKVDEMYCEGKELMKTDKGKEKKRKKEGKSYPCNRP
jgi:hypothetical protein